MNLYDGLIKVGRYRVFRPMVSFILGYLVRMPFYLLLKIAGRRLVIAFAASPAILLSGSNLKEAPQNADLLYKAMRFTVESMHLDTYCLMADLSIEAEACGCSVNFDETQVPSIQSHIVNNKKDIQELIIPDPYRDGRMPVFLETMRLMKRNFIGFKLACVTGPFTLALNIRGPNIYIDTIKNPEMVMSMLELTTEIGIRYAQALVKEGADLIVIAEPACSQLSPEFFNYYSLPYTKKVISAIKRNCVLHICGNAEHLIQLICQSGAAAISIDEVDIPKLLETAPSQLVIAGNLNPLKFALSSPKEIGQITSELHETVKGRSSFIIAPGCDLPPQTPIENMRSFVESIKPVTRNT